MPLDTIGHILTLGTIVGFAVTLLARVIPNEKIYAFGVKSGQLLNVFGSSKMGTVLWEKVEHFLVNSLGEYFRGMKDGLG